MSLTKLLPAYKDNNEANSSLAIRAIIKDVVPRSMSDDNHDHYLYTGSYCPIVSNWCVKDALGLSCSLIILFLFLYAQFVAIFVVFTPKNDSSFRFIHLSIFHFLEFLAISSYCRTMFSNPGTVPLSDATPENLSRYDNGTVIYRCAICQSIRPPRAHHCRVCKRCIKRMDHHCVFVNNCVGQNNRKYFILFTFYTCIISNYGLVYLCIHVTTCITSNWTACPAWSPPVTLFFMIFSGFEAFFFSMFTTVMTGVQLYGIYTDTTEIELWNGKINSKEKRNSFLSSLKTVFGSHIGLRWLNPFCKPIDFITQTDEHITFDI